MKVGFCTSHPNLAFEPLTFPDLLAGNSWCIRFSKPCKAMLANNG